MKPFYAVLGFCVFIVLAGIFVWSFNQSHRDNATAGYDSSQVYDPYAQPVGSRVETHVIEKEVAVPVTPEVIEKKVYVPVAAEKTDAALEKQASTGTASAQKLPDNVNTSEGKPVSVFQKKTLTQGGPQTPGTFVAHTPQEWQNYWQEQCLGSPPLSFNPQKEMAVGIFLGSRNTGGYRVKIDSIKQDNGRIVVHYQEIAPPSGSAVSQNTTTPGVILTLPRSDKEVVFEEDASQTTF